MTTKPRLQRPPSAPPPQRKSTADRSYRSSPSISPPPPRRRRRKMPADKRAALERAAVQRPLPVSSRSFSHANPHSHSHSHSNSHPTHLRFVSSAHSHRPPSSTTPLGSPTTASTSTGNATIPHSVGQPLAPNHAPIASASVSASASTSASTSTVPPRASRPASPNYFGLIVDKPVDPPESTFSPPNNWGGSATSSVKSFGGALPKQLPLDANPEFEAFRRQAELNCSSPFNFNGASLGVPTPGVNVGIGPGMVPPAPSTPGLRSMRLRPPPMRRSGLQTQTPTLGKPHLTDRMEVDGEKVQDSAYGSSDSKRNSEEEESTSTTARNTPPAGNFGTLPRYHSPGQVESLLAMAQRSTLVSLGEKRARLSMDQGRGRGGDGRGEEPVLSPISRADSLPTKLENSGPSMLNTAELKNMVSGIESGTLLLLDIRVSPQYAVSRIKGALNLCIPTTLLKRATFNLEKLQQTFQNDADLEAFCKWRDAKSLVVYDSSSSEKRDAQSAVNMLKKFTNEGYTGATYILRGGFSAFEAACPDLVDRRCGDQLGGGTSLSLKANAKGRIGPKVAPVIGGVMLPMTKDAANPFFGNIRQNQDLRDGVGQFDVSVPSGIDTAVLPQWLRTAAEPGDHGKEVADKFLGIERREQSRMKDAYSIMAPRCQDDALTPVQLCGIEKGGKNRYKDILPFEHARVKLQNRDAGACDYVNASHIKPHRSNKRYVASQGPLPATFEDFWSVIWDQDIRVIVMLTAESEGGQLKCHSYWRDKEFGPIRLRTLSEKKVSLDIDKPSRHKSVASVSISTSSSSCSSSTPSHPRPSAQETGRRRANTTTTLGGNTPAPQTPPEPPFVVLRKFALENTLHPFAPIREVTQLHYSSWPDLGTPAQPSHLLALVELSNVMQRAASPVDSAAVMSTSRRASPEPAPPIPGIDEPEPDSCSRPILVHCSAGCGRTGAFCTVDSVIDMLKRQRLASLQGLINKDGVGQEAGTDGDGDVDMMGDTGSTVNNADGEKNEQGDMELDENEISPLTTTTSHPLPSVSSSLSLAQSTTSEAAAKKLCQDSKTLDLSWLGGEDVDLIQKTVEDFRGQRLSMVQTLRQYVLCYETILEWMGRAQAKGMSRRAGPQGDVLGRGRSGSFGFGNGVLGKR